MIKTILQAIIYFLVVTLLTGIIYPSVVASLGQLLWPHESMGSLIKQDDQVVGSALIAQKFTSMHYFWPRPSADNYNTLPASGSNLGPTSKKLKESIETRRKHLAQIHNCAPNEVPDSLLTSSASGIEPTLPIEAILFQINRVAKARNLSHDNIIKLRKIINELPKRSFLAPNQDLVINVLLLNLSLDKVFGKII